MYDNTASSKGFYTSEYSLYPPFQLTPFTILGAICCRHVILLSNIMPKYSTLSTKGIFRTFNIRRASTDFHRWEKDMA